MPPNKVFQPTVFASLLLAAALLVAGSLPPSVAATELPAVGFSAAALAEAKRMLAAEPDPRAVLTLINGRVERRRCADCPEEKQDGWMLQVVNREQVTEAHRISVSGLEVLVPQEQFHPALHGSTLDFLDGWWVLRSAGSKRSSQPLRPDALTRAGERRR